MTSKSGSARASLLRAIVKNASTLMFGSDFRAMQKANDYVMEMTEKPIAGS
ncbi:hypothetical protein [Bradyrhizobium sp. STM 3557]|uniref:hypothetical protein n=1 Tax=Bradyrhizobium sp. STM 3557 TaxID=578920 RepID=UPI00388F16F8